MYNTRYTIEIYTPQELNHSSYIQSGLFELAREHKVKVKVKLSMNKNKGRVRVGSKGELKYTNHYQPKTSWYKLIDHEKGKETTFACDLYDAANEFSTKALENCEYLFKRNYEQKIIDRLPEKNKQIVHKLGLTFGVHSNSKSDTLKFYIANFLGVFVYHTKFDSNLISRLIKNYKLASNHRKLVRTTRLLSLFESKNTLNLDNKTILFQTRCFLNEKAKDVQEIHKQRYELIHFLRNNFSKEFIGGFIPSKIVKEKYKNTISTINPDPLEYFKAVKYANIVIYTRGLVNSPAWKMAEYCSQGKIIMAEKLTAELPVELQNGTHVLWFDDHNTLKKNIKKVINDVELAKKLSINSKEYFDTHIHPEKNIERILKIMGCEI